MNEPTLFIATPLHDGKLTHQWVAGALQTQVAFAGRTRFEVQLGSFLPRNRDLLASRFLASGASHMLCVDADVGWKPAHVEALLAVDKPFVAGCYAKKDGRGIVPAKLLERTDHPVWLAEHVPAGFLLLTRECVAAMSRQYADLAYEMPTGERSVALWSSLFEAGVSYDGEDVAFCRRWRQMGGECWLHTAVHLEHVGDQVYRVDPQQFRAEATLASGDGTKFSPEYFEAQRIAGVLQKHSCLMDPQIELPVLIEAFRATPARRFLEIGTWRGATAAAMCVAFPNAEIVTLDLPDPQSSKWNPQPREHTGAAYRELGLEGRITQLLMDSKEAGKLAKEPGFKPFDLVFVDGDHSEEGAYADLVTAAALSDNGTVVVHDYTDESDSERKPWTISVQRAVDRFLAWKKGTWQKTRLPGWLVRLEPLRVHRDLKSENGILGEHVYAAP